MTRRSLLIGGGAAGVGAIGATIGLTRAASSDSVVVASGRVQPGITSPTTTHPYGLVAVFDSALESNELMARLGSGVSQPEHGALTIGVGPRTAATVDARIDVGPLPAFAGDASIDAACVGGELLVMAHGADPGELAPTVDVFAATLSADLRWSQTMWRDMTTGQTGRNTLGFYDGVNVPRDRESLDANVFIADGPASGGTVCVVRRLRVDATAFAALPMSEQEAIVGRRRADNAPLNGGSMTDETPLDAVDHDGRLVTPLDAHARVAHRRHVGGEMMLRRSYRFDNRNGDEGTMFIAHQRHLATFVDTQHRLDQHDRLMRFVTATASASFLVLPARLVPSRRSG